MRIRGQSLSPNLPAEVIELFLRQLSQQKGIGVKAGGRVSLRVYEISTMIFRSGVPEVVVANVVEGRGRCEAGNVTTHIGVLVGAQYHCHGVPANIGTNTMLQRMIARRAVFLPWGNGIDIRG